MNYYYLDSSRKPQGPHSLDELAKMLREGKLTPSVEVAYRGAEEWKPLSSLLGTAELTPAETSPAPAAEAASESAPAPASAPAAASSIGACPYCDTELTPEADGAIPRRCPQCSVRLRPDTFGFISCVISGFAQFANFRGRATRAEFWYFYLFGLLIIWPLSVLDAIDPGGVAGAVMCLFGVIFFLPMLSLTVRRLHDTGKSAACLIWLFVTYIAQIFFLTAGIIFILDTRSSTGILGITLAILGLLCSLAGLAITIFLLGYMLFDSSRGPNRYGPSAKYPLA